MSIRDALQDGGNITVELYGLDRIVDQLELIGLACGRIADSLPIPFVPVVPDEAKDPEHVMVKQTKLDEALGLVRLILDSEAVCGPGLSGSTNAARLYEVEAILSRELGNPIWEGRR